MRTPEEELGVDSEVTLQVSGDNVGERGDEERVIVRCCGSPNLCTNLSTEQDMLVYWGKAKKSGSRKYLATLWLSGC